VVNPGGPGASAVDTVASMGASLAGSDILRRFDLVGIDPRGVAIPRQSCGCRTDAEFDAFRREPMADYSQAGVAQIEGLYSQFAQTCADRMGTEFLANVGTASSARDMDVVRAALGENQINYLGFSYGTQLGAAYAERYGDRVRAMVLDGAVDPSLDPIAASIRQMAGFQTAFNDYAATAHSRRLPLGTDRRSSSTAFHQAVDRWWPSRRYVGSAWPWLSGRDDGTVNALYARRYWQYLTSGLLGLQRGTDAGDLLLLADDYQHRDGFGSLPEPAGRVHRDPLCRLAIPTDPAVWADADRQIREVAPFMAYGGFTGFARATRVRCGRCRRHRLPIQPPRPVRQGRRRLHPRMTPPPRYRPLIAVTRRCAGAVEGDQCGTHLTARSTPAAYGVAGSCVVETTTTLPGPGEVAGWGVDVAGTGHIATRRAGQTREAAVRHERCDLADLPIGVGPHGRVGWVWRVDTADRGERVLQVLVVTRIVAVLVVSAKSSRSPASLPR